MGASKNKKTGSSYDRLDVLESKVDELEKQLRAIVREYQRPKAVLLKLLAKG